MENSPYLSRLSRLTDRDFYATVFRPAVAGIVAVDGVGLAFTPGRDLAAIHTRARQIVGGSAGAPLGQLLVVRLGADRVGVTDDFTLLYARPEILSATPSSLEARAGLML